MITCHVCSPYTTHVYFYATIGKRFESAHECTLTEEMREEWGVGGAGVGEEGQGGRVQPVVPEENPQQIRYTVVFSGKSVKLELYPMSQTK